MSAYVVKVRQGIPRTPDTEWVYLEAISYRAYETSEPYRAVTHDVEEAFQFKSEVAAEFAAAFVGGKVEKLR